MKKIRLRGIICVSAYLALGLQTYHVGLWCVFRKLLSCTVFSLALRIIIYLVLTSHVRCCYGMAAWRQYRVLCDCHLNFGGGLRNTSYCEIE